MMYVFIAQRGLGSLIDLNGKPNAGPDFHPMTYFGYRSKDVQSIFLLIAATLNPIRASLAAASFEGVGLGGPFGLVIWRKCTLASQAIRISGTGVSHASRGGHPSQPVAMPNNSST
jgi:hypothetical protein